MNPVSTIRLNRGNADVTVGANTFTVSMRNGGHATGVCPAELVIAALGS